MKYRFEANKYNVKGEWVERKFFRYPHKEAAEVLRARVKGIEVSEDLGTSATGYTQSYKWECRYID